MRRVTRLISVLTGCTAVGKTELALRWAEANGAEIVSCDSLLFYRGMNIGTAKPAPSELARIRHHLIDCRALSEPMDVSTYVAEARQAVADILARGRAVLVTGGSGFYLKAFFAPVADEVAVSVELRGELQARLAANGLADLVAELHLLNPAGLGALDQQNPRRVLRALERCRASGRTLAQLQAEFAAQAAPFHDCTVRLCELIRDKDELDERIGQRVKAMLASGLLDEVRGLLAQGLQANPSAARAIGYRETIEVIEGCQPESGLAEAIEKNTRALVKKQRTWFKTQLPPHRQVVAKAAKLEDIFD